MRIRALALALCLAASSTSALAQGVASTAQQGAGPVWERQQLSDLANVLGGAHYLRILCQGRGDQRWRDYMRGVIQHYPRYSDVLTEQFNAGYRDQEARYPVCDQQASQAEAELRARGLRISNGLSAHRVSAPPAPQH